jgi:DNA-binding transcriptional regulator YhcF (GntR family)
MNGTLNDQTSIYLQIAQNLENDLLRGVYLEEEQVPSTNELARIYHINPATAAKGVNLLVADGILYKKRGIGMFVTSGACAKVRAKRKDAFFDSYVKEMVKEGRRLDLTPAELIGMVAKAAGAEQEEAE